VKIVWKSSKENTKITPLRLLNLEYAVQLQVIKILIKQVEHLMDYQSLIVVEVDPQNGAVCINKETPEPLYSILQRNFHGFDSKMEKTFSIREKVEHPSFMSV
jgi:hypothetical protein